MLDVLLFLSVSWWFLESFDDEGGCRGNDGDGSLSVLDGELDCDAKSFLLAVSES